MTERLVIRVAIRDEPEQAAAGGDRGALSKPARGWRGPWIVGVAIAVGLSIIVAVALLTDFSGGRSIQDNATASEARTNDRDPLEAGGDPQTDTAAFPMEPAARPALERESVPAQAAVRPTASVADVVEETRRPIRPSVAERKPVEKPVPAVSREKVAPDPPEAAAVRMTKPEVAAVVPTVRSGQHVETGDPEPVAAPVIADPRVLRAQLSAGVNGKEPTARLQPPIQVTGRSNRTIYYFSEVRDFDGQTLFHRWEREGRVLASVPVKIRGQRWRFYSRKTITPGMIGDWRVVLADSRGKELSSSTFSVR
jgi:hypothetical protein